MTINIGETIKSMRKEKDITQETLANFLGVTNQSISKWERNETYPDITMLPAIASFFGISVDNLLGINKIEQERKQEYYCSEYSRLWSEHKFEEVTALMKNAVCEFPGNFDLLVKYLNCLTSTQNKSDYLISVKTEAESIYEMIQEHCTTDSIRIWAKKLMCRYLSKLSSIAGSGVNIEEAEKVLMSMPLMQNARDFEAMYIYYDYPEKKKQACANGVSELLRLLGESLFRAYEEPTDYDEKILESYISLLHAVMPDDDYGKSFNHIIYDYGYLGVKKYLKGDKDGAIKCFEQEVRLAKDFDSLPDVSVCTSPVVRGATFEKNKTHLGTEKMQHRVKYLLSERYPLSEDFRENPQFIKLLNSIG